jgi:hypothetical protein
MLYWIDILLGTAFHDVWRYLIGTICCNHEHNTRAPSIPTLCFELISMHIQLRLNMLRTEEDSRRCKVYERLQEYQVCLYTFSGDAS